jgi:hypothetical protein
VLGFECSELLEKRWCDEGAKPKFCHSLKAMTLSSEVCSQGLDRTPSVTVHLVTDSTTAFDRLTLNVDQNIYESYESKTKEDSTELAAH